MQDVCGQHWPVSRLILVFYDHNLRWPRCSPCPSASSADKKVLRCSPRPSAALRFAFSSVASCVFYPNPAEAPPEVKQAVAYLWKNRRPMNYAVYRKAGFPIGNGTVESAAKTLIQQRMKQAGMRWSRFGAQAMLALRARLLSDRWHEIPQCPPSPKNLGCTRNPGQLHQIRKKPRG